MRPTTKIAAAITLGCAGLSEWPPAGAVGASASAEPGAVYQGGPGPGFHFLIGVSPGASFCTGAQSENAVDRNQVPWN